MTSSAHERKCLEHRAPYIELTPPPRFPRDRCLEFPPRPRRTSQRPPISDPKPCQGRLMEGWREPPEVRSGGRSEFGPGVGAQVSVLHKFRASGSSFGEEADSGVPKKSGRVQPNGLGTPLIGLLAQHRGGNTQFVEQRGPRLAPGAGFGPISTNIHRIRPNNGRV